MTTLAPRRVLLRNGVIHSAVNPFATAMLVEDDRIAWLGDEGAADIQRDVADDIIDLDGRLVTPGFVDAHVHATSTGLSLIGLDLSGCRSREAVLNEIAHYASVNPGHPIWAHGWDETTWASAEPLTTADIDRAANGAPAYLARVDVHSALASTALRAAAATPITDSDILVGDDHHRVRTAAWRMIDGTLRTHAQQAFLRRCSELGIVAVHEMAGPVVSSEDDLIALLDLATKSCAPKVFAYWGELATDGGIERATSLHCIGAGGDLFVDGSLGSHTACVSRPYADAPESTGVRYVSDDEIESHLRACVSAGMQSGFHVIGDAGLNAVLRATRRVASALGSSAIRSAGVRLEHVEMMAIDDIETMADLGIVASVQPMFDALWGGPDGMYERRVGADRACSMNRFVDLARAGVIMAFGSDAPVTQLGPWAAVRAAVQHSNPTQRLSARAAFSAHTRAGWRAVGVHDAGVLAPGAKAHYVIWDARELSVQVDDDSRRNWSTDPRSATPPLPTLGTDITLPTALRTVVDGRIAFDAGAW